MKYHFEPDIWFLFIVMCEALDLYEANMYWNESLKGVT